MSLFAFLTPEWPDVHDAAVKAETEVHSDPRKACFYARRALELVVHWLYKHDAALAELDALFAPHSTASSAVSCDELALAMFAS
jgi:hypothetical protein